MQKAILKAEHWLNDNVAGWNKKQLDCLVVLLKEQDRDTRHACAEKVNELAINHKTITYAHNAIMNTKAL